VATSFTAVQPDDIVRAHQRDWQEVKQAPTWGDVQAKWGDWYHVLQAKEPGVTAVAPDDITLVAA